MRIADKISLSIFIVAAIITSIAAPTVYILAKNVHEDATYMHLSATAQSRADNVKTFLGANKKAIKQLSESSVIGQFLLSSRRYTDYSKRLYDVIRRLKVTAGVMTYAHDIFVLNKSGIIVASSEERDIGKDKTNDPYFQKGKDGVFISDAFISRDKKKKVIAFSAPVFGKRNNAFLGVVVATVPMEEINRIMQVSTGLGETSESYLVNKDGYMITSSHLKKDIFPDEKVDTENTRKGFSDVKRFGWDLPKSEPIMFTDYRGVKVLGTYAYIPEMQWLLLVEVNEMEALAPLVRIRNVIAIVLILVLVVAWLLGKYVSGLISGPIHELRKGTEVVGHGDLNYKVGTVANDEIGQLSRAFDQMTEDLKKTTTSIDNLNKEIIERRRAEGALRESEARYQRMVANAPGLVYQFLMHPDGSTSFPFVSKSCRDLFGLDPEDVKQDSGLLMSIMHIEDRKAFYRAAVRSAKTHLPWIWESRGIVSGEERWFRGISRPEEQSNGDILWDGLVMDITERKKAEEKLEKAYQELKETQRQLMQTSKMAAMGQLAAGISHELNQPLTGIKGFAQAALMDLDGDSPLMEDLNKIVEQTNRMSRIIDNVRFFAKKSEFKMEELNINKPVEDSLLLLTEQLKIDNITLNKSLAKDLPSIAGDSNQLQQVFLNFMTNARDAIDNSKKPDGGELFIKTSLSKDKKNVEVSFKDTGCGISKDNLEHVFNPFYTTKSPDKGMGLGLSIAYRIIENHKGRIEIESEEGKGTTFKITLPTAK